MAAGRFVPSATAGLARKFHNPNITVARSGERLQRMFREILVGWPRPWGGLQVYQYGEESLCTPDVEDWKGTRSETNTNTENTNTENTHPS